MKLGRSLLEMRRHGRPDADTASIELGKDELFELLSDSRRRFVIERLADQERDVPTCAALSVEIAADETHMAPEQVPRRRVQPVERDLREEQLPRLAEAGIVQWDGGAGVVRPGHSVGAIAELLDEVDRRIDPESAFAWSTFGACDVTDGRGSQGSRT